VRDLDAVVRAEIVAANGRLIGYNVSAMTTLLPPASTYRTMSDLLSELGDLPPERVLLSPLPGTATEQDVIDLDDHHDRLCELVDGVLVEKPMGVRESMLASLIINTLVTYTLPRKLGIILAPDGLLRLRPRLVRMPDVSFIAYQSIPGRKLPGGAIWPIAPDLAVEILSKSNTKAEMARKRREYFEAGTQLVWEFDAEARTVAVYTAAEKSTLLDQNQTLGGEPVLPGLTISLSELFAQLDQLPPQE
jgi:Uma2 family endonuclease